MAHGGRHQVRTAHGGTLRLEGAISSSQSGLCCAVPCSVGTLWCYHIPVLCPGQVYRSGVMSRMRGCTGVCLFLAALSHFMTIFISMLILFQLSRHQSASSQCCGPPQSTRGGASRGIGQIVLAETESLPSSPCYARKALRIVRSRISASSRRSPLNTNDTPQRIMSEHRSSFTRMCARIATSP